MKRKAGSAALAIMLMCFIVSVFYLREITQAEKMSIPVRQVFSYAVSATPTLSPLENYQLQREKERAESVAVLTQLSEKGDENAEEYLLALIDRDEKELAIESALSAAGYALAVCAVRDGSVTVCVQQRIETAQAQWIMELCEKITGECAENVFLLDESGYSW